MNIGLFGGTFNPFHNGHIEIIKYVAGKFALKKVLFIPCAIPPHKGKQNLAPAKDRYDMVALSLGALPDTNNFFASDIELKREGPSYTIDTINEIKKMEGKDNQCFLIMGTDAFFDIQTWKNFKEIFNEICVILMLRKQEIGQKKLLQKIEAFIINNISSSYKINSDKDMFTHSEKNNILIAHVPKIDISSTMIRKLIRQGNSINNLIPPSVSKQIYEKGLYL
ncbi:MAG: nicotinate (nicotinamide) nucleotide adenylyltransferase [Desulfobacteraceae bacterium]|nr:nicotinate (nicotinamide) nucleotide adenylyltransferase [Desulfobacteraceae bacterium]